MGAQCLRRWAPALTFAVICRVCVSIVLAASLTGATIVSAQDPRQRALSPTLDAAVRQALVDSISRALRLNYVWPDTAATMAAFMSHQLRSGAYDGIADPEQLAAALTRDLRAVHHDVHLSITYDSTWSGHAGSSESRAGRRAAQAELQRDARSRNFGFTRAEVLPGNIGLVSIDRLFDVDRESIAAVNAAFSIVRHSDALIIDLRADRGGSPDMVRQICNYLFPVRTHLNDLFERRRGTTTQYWTVPDRRITTLFSVPVFVLVSRQTFSAAEELAYDLQSQRRAVIVGETTGGGAHAVWGIPVGHGFSANIPYARAINPVTHTNWEGIGVQPDIRVGADSALEAAVRQVKLHPFKRDTLNRRNA